VLEVLPKNTANTSVLNFGGRLLALFEGGQPYELNPTTLETIGLCTLDRELQVGVPFQLPTHLEWAQGLVEGFLGVLRSARRRKPSKVVFAGDAVCAHWRIDPVTGRLITMSYRLTVCHLTAALRNWHLL
jgi:carotenoid cleavage dioxygenase-like enzyme